MKDPFEDTRTDSTTALFVLIAIVVGALVVSAFNATALGVVLMFLAIILVVMLHEAGHFLVGRRAGMKCTEFFVGFGPRIWSFRRGETEYGVKGILAGGYVRVIGMSNLEEVAPEDESRTYRQAPFRWRLALALAGVTMNVMLCFVLVFAVFWGQGKPEPSTTINALCGANDTTCSKHGGPAAKAGVKPGDEVVAVDGVAVRGSWDHVVSYLRARPGQAVVFTVLRTGTPRDITVQLASRNPAGDEVGFAGISPETRFASLGPIRSVGEAGTFMWTATTETVAGFGRVFSPAGVQRQVNAVGGKASPDPAQNERPVSIIGIVQLAGEGFANGGFWYFLYFLGFFNLILAIFNLVPLLPFDGGHVAIACYEKVASRVTGRRVQADLRKLVPITAALVVFIVLVFLSSAYLDIRNLFG